MRILKEIENDITENHWEDYLTLEVTEINVSATFSAHFSLENCYRYYMRKSLCVELVQIIFENFTISLDQLIDEFFISRTTFYRRIVPLKEVLAEFDLELDFTNKQCIVGEEKQIRYFFSIFFWDIFRSIGSYKHPALTDEKYVSKIRADLNLSLETFIFFQLCLNIALTRITQGYQLVEDISYSIIEINYSYALFKDLITPYFTKLGQIQQDREIKTFYFFCLTGTIYPKSMTRLIPMTNIPELNFARQWILYYTDYFNTILSDDDYVYLYVNLILLYEKTHTFHGGTSTFGVNSVTEVLTEKSPYILKQATQFFRHLSKQNEEFYIAPFQMLDYTLLIRRLIASAAHPLNLLVCSKVGLEEVEWIQNLIRKKSSVPVKFNLEEDLDLVISDFPLPLGSIPVPLEKLFVWLTFPNPTEWRTLLEWLETIYYRKLDSDIKL